VRILQFGGKFNYSAINNFGAAQSNGEILLLLNNDIEMIEDEWLTELVSHAMRPGIGAVGGRLYYSDNRIQHDGILLGIGGVAGYANPGLKRYAVAAFGGSRLIRNFSAVTAAVLAVRKDIFNAVNGLDEVNLEVAFNDVDFCLRVAEAGYRNLYTPYCELFHHESLSRGSDTGGEKALRFQKEVNYMKKKWSEVISDDPYYNPNLSLDHGFTLDVNRGSIWPWEADKERRRNVL
jgi:GT2 family glycosyltransferase